MTMMGAKTKVANNYEDGLGKLSVPGLNKANMNRGEGEENIKGEESTRRRAAQSATLF
jgi:hypothetical protein